MPAGRSAPRMSPEPEYRLSSLISLRRAPRRHDRSASWLVEVFNTGNKYGELVTTLRTFAPQWPVRGNCFLPVESGLTVEDIASEVVFIGKCAAQRWGLRCLLLEFRTQV